jgi:acetyl-CoA acetyltransferase
MSGGRAAIVGVGESTYYRAGRSPHDAFQLACIAIRQAVADAGLRLGDIDGLVTFMDRSGDDTRLASTLGFANLRFCAHPWSGGGNLAAAAVLLADAAVCAGHAAHVVVFRSIDQGRGGRFGQARSTAPAAGESAYLSPFGAAAPVVRNALLASKFLADHGLSTDALAEISLAAYAHAQHNPRAVMYGRPLTRADYHASRMIAEPFHLYDCCQENDGACAVVVTSAERARDLPQPPAYILGGAVGMEPHGGLWAFNDDAFPNGRFRTVGQHLWSTTGVRPEDVDVAQFYENFTATTLMAIADIGFCDPGDVGDFVSGGALLWPDGRLPLNTSGGNLAEAYIHGFQLVNEAARQIRGDSTCPVADAELSLCVAGPGTPPSGAVLLGRSV